MYFTIKQPWGMQKPVLGSQIDWSHPLARGLCWYWLFNEGAGKTVMDLCRPRSGVMTGGTWVGAGVRFSGSGEYCAYPEEVPIIGTSDGGGTGDFSITTRANPRSDTGVECLVTQRASVAQARMSINALPQDTPTPGALQFLTYDTYFSSVGVAGIVDGLWHTFSVIRLGALHSIVSDGVLRASDTMTVRDIAEGAPTTGVARLHPNVTTQDYTGDMDFVMAHDRALSAAEIAWLYAEPYAMIQAPEMPVFYSIPAGPATAIAAIRYHYERLRMSA